MSAPHLHACFRLPAGDERAQCDHLQLLIDRLQELASLLQPPCELEIKIDHGHLREHPAPLGV